MRRDDSPDVTRLLQELGAGRPEALERLLPVVYGELHTLARALMRKERSNHSLQVTGLVSEAFIRLVDQRNRTYENRRHFFSVAARCMRRVLADYARHRNARKRGAGQVLSLDESIDVAQQRGIDFEALHEALDRLEALDERQARIVELRYYVGLSTKETAEVMGLSVSTINDDWRSARLWLTAQLGGAQRGH